MATSFQRMQQRGATEAEVLSSGDVPLEREIVVAADTGAFWIGNGRDSASSLPKQGPISAEGAAGVLVLPTGEAVAGVDRQTLLPATQVRQALAAVLSDPSTPEGAAVADASVGLPFDEESGFYTPAAAGPIAPIDADTQLFPESVLRALRSAIQTGRPQLLPGRRYGFLGDSITNGSSASNFAYSFSSQAVQMVGAMTALPNFVEAGVPGQNSGNLVARLAQFIANGIDGAVVLAGTNDAGQAVAVADYAANMTKIISTLLRAGIPPIVVTVPPRGSSATASVVATTDAYNMWLRIHVPLLGGRLADAHLGLVDQATGYLKSVYDSGDGVHPNNAGHQVIATAVARQMRELSGVRKPRGLVVGKTAANLVDDPLSARSSAGNWFEFTGNNAGVAITFADDASGELPAGRWTQWEFDATAAGGVRQFAIPNLVAPAAGTRLIVTAHVQVEDVAGGWESHIASGTASLSMNVLNANSGAGITTALQRTIGLRRTDAPKVYDIGPVVFPFDMPSGVTSMALVFYLTLPTGDRVKLRAGAVGLLNATALGIDSEFAYLATPTSDPA
jgi:lysophospholipase L1-like esterase